MQLLYIWIDNYRNIKEQGFSFSSEFLFEYNPKENELTIMDNPNYIPNFFGEDIVEVTGIVGKNGSGKSTVLEFLFEKSHSFFTDSMNKNFVLLCKGEDSMDKKFYLAGFTSVIYKEKRIIPKTIEKKDSNPFSIYYNHIFPGREQQKLTRTLDVSTNSLIFPGREQQKPTRTLDVSTNGLISEVVTGFEVNALNLFRFEEMNREVKFLKSELSDSVFEEFLFRPQALSIKVENDVFPLPQFEGETSGKEIETFLKKYFQIEYSNGLNEKDQKNKNFIDQLVGLIYEKYSKNSGFMDRLRLSLTLSCLFVVKKNLKDNSDMKNIIPKELNIEELKKTIKNDYFEVDISTIEKKLINPYIEVERYFEAFFEKKEGFKLVNNNTITISINSVGNAISSLLKIYFNCVLHKHFLRFNWATEENPEIQLSSGEKVLMTLFSRLLYCTEEGKNEGRNNLLLLLDEPDINLHPQWQKKLIKIIVKALPQIFKGKTIQIILTSHSPFILSDLPKENVIFLDKDENGNCKVVPGLSQTFGQNIHTLLSDGFFLDDGLMGDFAKGKIGGVITDLKGIREKKEDFERNEKKTNGTEIYSLEEEDRKKLIEHKKMIDLIGEGILQLKLQQMYLDILPNDEEKIKFYEEKIQKIRNRK